MINFRLRFIENIYFVYSFLCAKAGSCIDNVLSAFKTTVKKGYDENTVLFPEHVNISGAVTPSDNQSARSSVNDHPEGQYLVIKNISAAPEPSSQIHKDLAEGLEWVRQIRNLCDGWIVGKSYNKVMLTSYLQSKMGLLIHSGESHEIRSEYLT